MSGGLLGRPGWPRGPGRCTSGPQPLGSSFLHHLTGLVALGLAGAPGTRWGPDGGVGLVPREACPPPRSSPGILAPNARREHRLTTLLRESLAAASCRATMIAHVSDAPARHAETLSTVQLAARIHRLRRKKVKVGSDSRAPPPRPPGRSPWGSAHGGGGAGAPAAIRAPGLCPRRGREPPPRSPQADLELLEGGWGCWPRPPGLGWACGPRGGYPPRPGPAGTMPGRSQCGQRAELGAPWALTASGLRPGSALTRRVPRCLFLPP